jgi:hypothetical protein
MSSDSNVWCANCGRPVSAAHCTLCGSSKLRDAYGRTVTRSARPGRTSGVAKALAMSTAAVVVGGALFLGGTDAVSAPSSTAEAQPRSAPAGSAYGRVTAARPTAKPKAAAKKKAVAAPTAKPRRVIGRPPPGVGMSAKPLGTPAPPPPVGIDGYGFLATQTGSQEPITWDPCRPIRYVVRGTPPRGGATALRSAFAEISRITGFRFVYVGRTSEPAGSRLPYQPKRYGERWTPLLVNWSNTAESPHLAEDVIGYAMHESVRARSGRLTYVTGQLVLDTPFFADLAHAGTSDGRAMMRLIIIHELGHVMGLAHTLDAEQAMYPEMQLKVSELGDGDKRGLYRLSKGKCVPEL